MRNRARMPLIWLLVIAQIPLVTHDCKEHTKKKEKTHKVLEKLYFTENLCQVSL